MFKKYSPSFLEKEVASTPYPGDNLSERPHAPFSTGLMNSTIVRHQPEEASDEPETVIAPQVEIKGSLSFQRHLRIDGSFEGELRSSGKLVIGPTGSVKADLDLEEAYISGKVIGNITVKTRLVLRGRAEVIGNISAPLISVDEGVSIIGELSVSAMLQKPDHVDF
jgi:cytoskeletal protein CcmA (bactofilin family)